MIPLRNFKRFLNKALAQPGYALSVGFRRMRAYRAYRSSDGRSPMPEAMTLFLTHLCNLRCKMCGQWGEGGVTKRQSTEFIRDALPVDQMRDLIDQIAGDKPNITLFGGEPLLYPGVIELIRRIKEKRMHCLMITNGSLLEAFAGRLVDSGLDELNLSLDGGRALHDEIRGMQGLFANISSGVLEIQAHKSKLRRKLPLINLQCTITKYNYERLEEMLPVARQLGVDSLTFHNLIFLNQDIVERQKVFDQALNCSSAEWQGFVFEPGIDLGALENKIAQIQKGRYPFSVDFYPNFSTDELREYYRNPDYAAPKQNTRCLSPWLVAYVFPDGNVRPCLNSSYSFGNIREGKFSDIWNSAQARRYRLALKEKGIFPACCRCTELYRY